MNIPLFLKCHNLFQIILLICFIPSTVFAQKESKEIFVFAGAGMRIPLDKIGEKVRHKYGIKVLYDYEGSGRLGNKILAGQIPDVFIPGSDKWAKILRKKSYITDYVPIAFHTPVIITSAKNTTINSLHDFVNRNNRFVLGDTRSCAIGEVSAEIFKKAEIKELEINIKARAVSVKQLIFWIEENNADASIVWKADAVQSGKVRIIAIPEQYNVTSIIPVCHMVKDKKEAAEYIDYLLGAEGAGIFKKYGFEAAE